MDERREGVSMKILTNHPGQEHSPTWGRLSTRIRTGPGIISDLACALRLLIRAPRYDCVVLGAGRSDVLYSVLAAVLPVRLPPVYRIDCLWSYPRGRLHGFLKRVCLRLESRSVRRYFVWTAREVETYSRVYPVQADKIEFLPYHHTLNDQSVSVRNEGYIFSGGDSERDYETLLKAVDGLPIEVRIATTRPHRFTEMKVPGNVTVRRYSHREYLEVMAGCRINVVAMKGGTLRSAGHQTFLNSMALGKPTILTDPCGASGYIRDGHDGLVVEPGDPESLRAAILRIIEEPALEETLRANAMAVRDRHTTEQHFIRITQRIARDLGVEAPGGPVRAA